MNIVLVGYRCCGKTTVGKILARKLNRSFVDTDGLIEERESSSIEEIISEKGWHYFRDIEKQVVREVSQNNKLVIGTGGGVVLDQDNVLNLIKNGWVVWLKADAEVLKERMEKDHSSGNVRPSLTGTNPIEEIREVLAVRMPLYEQAGDFAVDTGRDDPSAIADGIIKEFGG
jgi:shikimate kinase